MLRLILVALPAVAIAAAPRGQAALAAEEPKQMAAEPQVRSSPPVPEVPTTQKVVNKVVSMEVEPNGHIAGAAKAATPVTIRAMETPQEKKEVKKVQEVKPHIEEAKPHIEEAKVEKKEVEAKAVEAKPHGQRVVAAQAPTDEPAQTQSQPQQSEDSSAPQEKSWKQAFFFFASLVLMVILAGIVMAKLYTSRKEGEQVSADRATLKAQEGTSGAASLQQHLNDSSSTSDSGEKIAMLFDRVRKSLEDLGDRGPNDAADVAGAGKGGQTNSI